MTDIIIRIALRYIAGALVFNGVLPDELGNSLMNDPQVIQVVNVGLGLAIASATEAWYFLARKFGWAK